MSGAFLNETPVASPPDNPVVLTKSPYMAAAAEAVQNYMRNTARTWYKDGVDPKDEPRKYAFQRLRETWFTPEVDPKFKLRREDKFYAIGSCFARGLESSLAAHKIAVESAAPEIAKLQPANKEGSGLGFTNKYNTYSILNELRWALDPDAEFPRASIVELTNTTWYDPHTNPTLAFVGLEETLERRVLMEAVTKRIRQCRAVIVTLGLVDKSAIEVSAQVLGIEPYCVAVVGDLIVRACVVERRGCYVNRRAVGRGTVWGPAPCIDSQAALGDVFKS